MLPIGLAAFGLLAVLGNAALSAQNTANAVYDRVIVGGRVMDPASGLDAIRNVGVLDGRIAVITTEAVRGRDTIDARGLVVCPGFIDLHAHGQTPETYRFQSLDGVTTSLELELGSSDVAAWYDERRAGQRINYGVSIGHITIFDAARVVDRSTYREPSLPPFGIQYVIVNGVPVVANGQAVDGVAPGKAVRAPIDRR